MIRKLVLAAALALAAGSAHAAECSLKQLASLDVTTIDGDLYVPVTLAGEKGLMRLTLTGITSIVSEDFVKRHDLRRDSINQNVFIRIAGQDVHQRVSVPLEMGGSKGDVHMGIVSRPLNSDPRTFGLLGLDALNLFDVELDLGHNKINLFSRDHCKGQVVYWTRTAPVAVAPLESNGQMSFVVPMQLEGKDIDAVFTTDQEGTINGDIARDDYATGDETSHVFKTLTVDGLGIANARILVRPSSGCNGRSKMRSKPLLTERNPDFERCFGEPDLTLGVSELKHLRIFISFEERNIYVTAANAS